MSKENKNHPIVKALISFGKTIGSLFTFGSAKKSINILEEEAVMSPGRVIFKNFFRNKLAIVGLTGIILMLLFVFLGSIIRPLDIYESESVLRNLPPRTNFLNFPKELERNGVTNIASGRSFSVATDNNGKVYFWGTDQNNVRNIPADVKAANIVKVAAGDRHALALSATGTIYAWGNNNHNQGSIPFEIAAILQLETPVDIGGGDLYSAVLTSRGNIYVWGSTLASRMDIVPVAYQGRIVSFDTSSLSILLLINDGTVGYMGERGSQLSAIPEFLRDGSIQVVDVAAAARTGGAIDIDGNIYLWGDSGNNMRNLPEELNPTNPNRLKAVEIEAGRRHFQVRTEDGQVFVWGSNAFDQATLPSSLDNTKVVAAWADYFQSYAFTDSNKLVAWGNKGFILGSDQSGRDMLTRLINGGRITMTVGAVAVLISTFIGVTVGLIAGFYGKWLDNVLMRFAEIVASFPFLPLAITLSSFLSGNLSQEERILMIMVILGVIGWPGLSRLVRGQILAEREKDFVLAARALGIRSRIIILRHILPNVINVVIVSMTLSYAGTLLTEAGLSFLGFGVVPPSPSWGNMLTGSQASEVIEFFWWRWILPALAVLLAALSVNLVGDGLREAMDPKGNEK